MFVNKPKILTETFETRQMKVLGFCVPFYFWHFVVIVLMVKMYLTVTMFCYMHVLLDETYDEVSIITHAKVMSLKNADFSISWPFCHGISYL